MEKTLNFNSFPMRPIKKRGRAEARPRCCGSMRFFQELRRYHASPVRDARLPFDSGWSAGRCAALRSPSLRSIRAAHDGSDAYCSSWRTPWGTWLA